ncbi:TPR repeat-containing protein-like protein [Hapsidospora chrysogenum ATCC 11550]|uniref:TPR repeat-containing protein-like protein n=1 Tax=Hapsidospora chrysogenum (strain ATCC 11550 / CBS 779.69 / DSM 880 / IAM 14645 / JCM 23072 / IMI 49137) TaxID=857340 RepID=A0A086T2F7_HAPC1|nr:TPR repeat-containing protein-like protein [Hapsidospora chrysogenum ATCC 11550]
MASRDPSSKGDDAPSAISVLASSPLTDHLIKGFATRLAPTSSESDPAASVASTSDSEAELLKLGIAALDAFLQANVTGPVLPAEPAAELERRFTQSWGELAGQSSDLDGLRKECLKDLRVDGVAPYAYIPHLELFGLARHIINILLPASTSKDVVHLPTAAGGRTKQSLSWMRLRINAWHYKLLTQPSLGHGSNFTRSSQWSDVPTLAARIFDGIDAVSKQVLGEEVWATDDGDAWAESHRTLFLVEAANYHILLGRSDLAKAALDKATQTSRLQYALSGALGKRTKFQEKSISQLVVLAKSGSDGSAEAAVDDEESARPDALKLNDDTLLEEIDFTKESDGDVAKTETLPPALAELSPDDQPQLSPLDQIILLTEATMKDAFSPIDDLTSEEILPFAVRVLADKSTNWQIYTQALLVRSRIEVHRSRTLERGVLQLQAVADQVLADTTMAAESSKTPDQSTNNGTPDVPTIQVTQPEQKPLPSPTTTTEKPTSFLPAPKPSESAPAHVRLQYIHALSAPPRWHLESELAYAWAGVGSLASALEIFKRLRLWAEVALCLASRAAAAAEDEDGRGSGGEEKARGIIRWRLFHRTGETASPSTSDPDTEDVGDVTELRADAFSGPERDPPPPDAPRLWCILGDIEDAPAHYERAWAISSNRYSRAQRSLGEHYVQQREWERARDAYRKATAVNRLNPDMWTRLGDVSLRLGNFEDAAEAYSRSISSATDEGGGEGAKTWSNLGSALWSLYCEVVASEDTKAKEDTAPTAVGDQDLDEEEAEQFERSLGLDRTVPREPSKLLAQALSAYKKGATIAHDNWRIWDNVLTLSARMRPPPVPDMVLATKHILRIRHSEDAIDADVLSALLQDVVLTKEGPTAGGGIYEPPRGSMERLVARLIEEEVVPLITHRSELWALVARLRAWRRDLAGAIEASERAWRTALGSSSSGLLAGSSSASSSTADWTTDKAAWETVVQRTDELTSMLENWGPDVESVGPKWKGKVRSAVRTVMGRGRENWEGSEGWRTLEGIMEGLKA